MQVMTKKSEEIETAPRGLLFHYVLYRLSQGPTYGYQLLKEIREKTEGAWSPGPGAIYPLLEKMEKMGLISKNSDGLYTITEVGQEKLNEIRSEWKSHWQKAQGLRNLMVEMLSINDINIFVEAMKNDAEIIKALLEKYQKIDDETIFMLKEYSLFLEKELRWVNNKLSEVSKGV